MRSWSCKAETRRIPTEKIGEAGKNFDLLGANNQCS